MLNQVVLMGRITRDPDTRFIQNTNNSVTRFSIAVDRDYKAANEERPRTDFISSIAWNKTGEFISKYFKKGSMIAVTGSIETGSYTDREGKKIYTTEIRVNKASFTGEKASGSSSEPDAAPHPAPDEDGFMNIPDGIEEELPFK